MNATSVATHNRSREVNGSLADHRRALRDGLVARSYRFADATDWIDVEAPATGEVIERTPRSKPEDVVAAVADARNVHKTWRLWTLAQRAAVLLRFHDLVLARQDEVLDIIQLETGKARMHAFEEVLDTASTARYYAHAGPKFLATRRRQGAIPLLTAAWELHHPRGVIGFVAPWNYPLSLGITDALPAILAGNGAIIKPDQQTPGPTLWAVSLLEEAGMPRGLIQVVTGAGSELGAAIAGSVDFLMFTGSTSVGRIVAAQAAANLIEYSMELGGKNAMIVLNDAKMSWTVGGGLRACFSNSGQLCISMERIYVQDGIYDEFVPKFAEATQRLKLRASMGYDADMGSLISAKQLATVEDHVNDAVAKGATVLAGGRARPDIGPYFYEPTLLTDVTPEMTLFRNETFGPVASIYRVSDVDEAVRLANDSEYGLNFSLWTSDTRRGREIATRLEAGTVGINEGYASGWGSVDSPMGGFKASGTGRRHGEHGILKYTEAQTVSVQRLMPLSAPPNFSGDKYAFAMTKALKLLKRVPRIK